MDPFSAEGELLNIHNAFHQGQYQEVVDFDTSSFSPENSLTARVLKLRARIALGQTQEVLADVESQDQDVPDLAAVKVLAQHVAGDEAEALKGAEELITNHSDNTTTQVLVGTVLQAQGKSEDALSLLSKHQGSLEAVALIVQIHLQQNRTDLALKEVQAARRWAQDSLLVNLAESWVGLRVGGEKYQSAFYVYEELASVPNTSSPLSIVGQAVSELHLGRLPEAEVALRSALEKYPNDVQLIANSIVLKVLSGKDATELTSSLEKAQPDHPFLTDLAEKSAFFDAAASKYAAKVSS
ncbi:epsilon-COP [Histoplasma capsulatum G186AR]|uniref:Coatomer subunit epsilon n=2 Tax=Ajellomyces capsulatus TaxID=5037 RepID=C0NRE5_AJECG|nr:epsilon-COP [Histoplasma capsulatum G186AR]EEH06259.1 epsilon-COP [Histoplasma capsulatum G186AR]KAG5293285.1 epsilon-COP [Histoplasma capsulatum]QSS74736.1 epsilon-COP [Histoplasma capsulatum G186AR]